MKKRNLLTWLFSDFTMMKAIILTIITGSLGWGGFILFTSSQYGERLSMPDASRWEIWGAILAFIIIMLILIKFISSRKS